MRKTAVGAFVGLVTCDAYPYGTPDDLELQSGLKDRGINVAAVAWNDPLVEWGRFDAVVLRSTWDYHVRYSAFQAWLCLLENCGIQTINSVRTIRWNADKRYLLQLAALGVDVIPTQVVAAPELPSHVVQRSGQALVIKPAVSGNSWHTVRGEAGTPSLYQALQAIPASMSYLVQPYVPEVETLGELSLIYFDGLFSHAVRKLPRSGDYRVQPDFGGSSAPLVPDAQVLGSAQQCLDGVASLGYGDHAFARVDGIVSDGRFQLMEVELIEPHMFLCASAHAVQRFSEAILASMGRWKANGQRFSGRIGQRN